MRNPIRILLHLSVIAYWEGKQDVSMQLYNAAKHICPSAYANENFVEYVELLLTIPEEI